MHQFLTFLWKNRIFWALLATWVAIFFGVLLISEKLEYQRTRGEEIENGLDGINNQINLLWNERLFINEMRENVAYYLPDGFESKVEFVGIKPLIVDIGLARVYFNYRGSAYSVDFSYTTSSQGLKIDRKSPVVRVN